jgi:M6 family metalloprotease-like protein
VDFWTLAHEMSHTFGTADLYAENCFSDHMTLMSCEPFIPDDKSIVYLDPWHRWKLGWVYPYDVGVFYGNVGDTGYYEVGDESWRDLYGLPSRPLIIRNPSPNSNEYFLFEYRGGRSYAQTSPTMA